MVKPRNNESLSHAYLVGAIWKYLKREADPDAKIYETKKPDIVFDVNGFKWAIEAETGFFTRDIMDFWRPNYREEEKRSKHVIS